MHPLCELTAAEIVCTIGGREYCLSPLTAGDLGRLERNLLAATADRDDSPPRASLFELANWLETPDGRTQVLWLCLRRRHPDVTREQAKQLLQQAADEGSDLGRRWPELLGGPPGNSSGQA